MQYSEPILRQRLIIEGEYEGACPRQDQAIEYIEELSNRLGMTIVRGPFVGDWANQGIPKFGDGWEAYAIWAESGIHIYAWDVETQGPLMTFEIYTCKKFNLEETVEFTKEFFGLVTIAYTEVVPPLQVTAM